MRKITQKQAELLARHHENGCINVRRLAQRTRIVIETSDEVFELEVGTPERGVVLIAGNRRYFWRAKAVVLGSLDPQTGIFLPEIIGYGLKLMLRRRYKGMIKTAPVIAARILGPGDSYEYRLWDGDA